jgi:hypothetical protein
VQQPISARLFGRHFQLVGLFDRSAGSTYPEHGRGVDPTRHNTHLDDHRKQAWAAVSEVIRFRAALVSTLAWMLPGGLGPLLQIGNESTRHYSEPDQVRSFRFRIISGEGGLTKHFPGRDAYLTRSPRQGPN